MTTDIPIHGEFITLGQLLKLAGVLGSGGEVRAFLQETSIRVNGEHDNRRGRKLHPGDLIAVEGFPETLRVVTADASEA